MSIAMEYMARIFRALADPARIRILNLVRRMELTVGELVQILGQSQPGVSRHIRVLAEAGLVERLREGTWTFVHAAPTAEVAQLILLIERDPAATNDEAALSRIRQERVAEAERYFAAHADDWDRIRAMHIADRKVEAAIDDLLGPGTLGDVLDIGTGTGRMIELLGPRANSVLGIDRSPEMLRLARGKLTASKLSNWSLRQGDMFALPVDDGTFDTVVLHQVLHFADRPAEAIAEAARICAPGGRIVIADFAPHQHEELRSEHAHRRLGFDAEKLAGWLRDAGLVTLAPLHLAGRPLTVTLWLAEKPRREKRSAA